MSLNDLTFRRYLGDRKIDKRPEYWYAIAVQAFIDREQRAPNICLCTSEDAAALARVLPADNPVLIRAASAENWSGKLQPLEFSVGIMPEEIAR